MFIKLLSPSIKWHKHNSKPKLKILRSDNGTEYKNFDMQNFTETNGLIHQTTCRDTPQQNGVVERKNRTLLEITRAMMIESCAPAYYWPEAISTANYLTNCLPTKSLHFSTPLATLNKYTNVPTIHSLPPRVFGCVVYVHLPKRERNKLEPRAVKCVFVGYGTTQKGYRCFNPVTKRLCTTMDCDFVEIEFYYHHLQSQGESPSEDLSWLVHPELSTLDPKEQVGDTTEATDNTLPPDHPEMPVLPNTMPTNPTMSESPVQNDIEVCTSELNHILEFRAFESTDMLSESENVEPGTNVNGSLSSDQGRYELPPRSTRGVPPKTYDLEFESQRSKYPVNKPGEGNLSLKAKAFNTALYSENIPTSTEEALKSKN